MEVINHIINILNKSIIYCHNYINYLPNIAQIYDNEVSLAISKSSIIISDAINSPYYNLIYYLYQNSLWLSLERVYTYSSITFLCRNGFINCSISHNKNMQKLIECLRGCPTIRFNIPSKLLCSIFTKYAPVTLDFCNDLLDVIEPAIDPEWLNWRVGDYVLIHEAILLYIKSQYFIKSMRYTWIAACITTE